MHAPQWRQPARVGAGAAEVRVGHRLAGLVRSGPRPGVGWNVSPTPIRSATARMARSAAVLRAYVMTPSIRLAWS